MENKVSPRLRPTANLLYDFILAMRHIQVNILICMTENELMLILHLGKIYLSHYLSAPFAIKCPRIVYSLES